MSRLTILTIVALAAPPAHAQVATADSVAAPRIVTTLSYTAEIVGDVTGGARHGVAVVGAAGAEVMVPLRPIRGWRGASAFLYLLGTHGGAPSDLVGDVQGVSNLEAPASVRLEEVWLQQNVLQERLSWLVGRYDLNTEFYRLQSGALFVNSSFGIGPAFSQSGVAGPSIFPHTAVGTRVAYHPSPNVVLRVAALDGVPVDRPDGGIHLFAPGDGALIVGELAALSRPATTEMPRQRRFRIGRGLQRQYNGKIAIGGWYYTARFPDLSDTSSGGVPSLHRGSRGVYIIGDQTVWSTAQGGPRAVTAFVQLDVGDARVNQIGSYIGGGLALTAPIRSRADDQLGLGVAAAQNGSHFERAEAALGVRSANEVAVELTYLAQIGSWLAVQPDLEYVIHPGGTVSARNAMVPGLRIAVSR